MCESVIVRDPIGRSTVGNCIGITGMGCYGSLSPVSGNEFLSHWNESLCVEMSRYEINRVVGHPPRSYPYLSLL